MTDVDKIPKLMRAALDRRMVEALAGVEIPDCEWDYAVIGGVEYRTFIWSKPQEKNDKGEWEDIL